MCDIYILCYEIILYNSYDIIQAYDIHNIYKKRIDIAEKYLLQIIQENNQQHKIPKRFSYQLETLHY